MDRDSVPDPSHGWDHHTLARGLRAALFVAFCFFLFFVSFHFLVVKFCCSYLSLSSRPGSQMAATLGNAALAAAPFICRAPRANS